MRQYEPIWIKIKSEGKCVIACEQRSQPRIVKAVIKEKYNDSSFKESASGYLQIIRGADRVTFQLVKRIGLGDL